MSYGVAVALQEAVYQRLSADAALGAILGDAIYDALPQGTLPPIYVVLGAEQVTDRSDQTGRGARHEMTVTVITDLASFATAKAAAAAVSDALSDAELNLSRGQLVAMNFHKARAARLSGSEQRQIDVIFRALVEDDPAGT